MARIYCSLVMALHPLLIFALLGWAMIRSGGVGAASPGYVVGLCIFLALLLLLAYRLGCGAASRQAFK